MKQSLVTAEPDAREDLLTMRDAADAIGTSRHKIMVACVLSGVRAVKVGSAYLLRREDLESLRRFISDGVPA